MKTRNLFSVFALLLFLSFSTATAQTPDEELKAYRDYLNSHQNMTSGDLEVLNPAGDFDTRVSGLPLNALYLDSLSIKYSLTEYEKELIGKNGFMVSQRLSYNSFMEVFADIFHKDMPLFISTDAILHSIHMSYDMMLMHSEFQYLIPNLRNYLTRLKTALPILEKKYASIPAMKTSLMDYDVFISVPMKIFDSNAKCYFDEISGKTDSIVGFINNFKPMDLFLFSSTLRNIDFSQFEPRGHYTIQTFPEFQEYFKVMMWFAKADLWFSAPRAIFPSPAREDLQRQSVLAMLLSEATHLSGNYEIYSGIDAFMEKFIGECDNVTMGNLADLSASAGITSPEMLLSDSLFSKFQKTLGSKSYAYQKIMSQILLTGFDSPDSLVPPSAFALFGQRFIPDSYVTGQVVFDRISFNGQRPKRMLPKELDILYALGNDPAARLLKEDIEKYHYASNLAMLRYIMNNYGTEFWNSSIYLGWLNSIRKLNPPSDRTSLPPFMQTAAWWQEKMNTQLASWTQLRHDNILYGKQSYSGMPICSYPYVYVEPIPEFYLAVRTLAENWMSILKELNAGDKSASTYLERLRSCSDTLYSIARKELNRENLTNEELSFLGRTLVKQNGMCGSPPYGGWYGELFFNSGLIPNDMSTINRIVADVHTSPADEFGVPVGWVLHAGTGKLNMGIFVAPDIDGRNIAYAGPVMSYYEYLTANFNRLTDEEWGQILDSSSPPSAPFFTNIYMADKSGASAGAAASIATGVEDETDNRNLGPKYLTAVNYPNPFNPSTIIKFTIPYEQRNKPAELIIYDIQGKVVRHLLKEALSDGNYIIQWDAKTDEGHGISSGIYLYRLSSGDMSVSGKMTYIK
ncbi:MAG: DUF3160 domain-containing protein [Bacteroidota bacterium]